MEIKKDGKFIILTDKDFTITVNKNFIHICVGADDEGVYIQESISDLIEALYQAQSIYEEMRDGEIIDLPDGSGCFMLPEDHWIYDSCCPYPQPVLDSAYKEVVVEVARRAIRAATMNGKEMDFDPDALVQNVVNGLCGPKGSSHEL